MPKRTEFVSLFVIGLAAVAPTSASAQEAAWTVAPPANGSASMSRTLENVTLTYKRVPSDEDTLRITVKGCGDQPWYMESSLNGVTAESLHDDVAEEFHNARLNCKLADGLEDRFMAGFDEAFARVKPFLPPHVQTVGGWKLEDKGGMPGDDSERSVTATKALATVSMVYRPSTTGDGASYNLECEGASYGGAVDFDDPPGDHLKAVNAQLAEDYRDFAKDCKKAPEAQAVLMQDFPEALKTVEQWMHDKPFVYPPETASNNKEN
jgi:hypothetical protein